MVDIDKELVDDGEDVITPVGIETEVEVSPSGTFDQMLSVLLDRSAWVGHGAPPSA